MLIINIINKHVIMLRLFEKKYFFGRKIPFVGADQNAGRGDRMAEAWRRRERQGEGFLGFGAHSSYQEAPEVIQWGSWLLCTPPSYGQV